MPITRLYNNSAVRYRRSSNGVQFVILLSVNKGLVARCSRQSEERTPFHKACDLTATRPEKSNKSQARRPSATSTLKRWRSTGTQAYERWTHSYGPIAKPFALLAKLSSL